MLTKFNKILLYAAIGMGVLSFVVYKCAKGDLKAPGGYSPGFQSWQDKWEKERR